MEVVISGHGHTFLSGATVFNNHTPGGAAGKESTTSVNWSSPLTAAN